MSEHYAAITRALPARRRRASIRLTAVLTLFALLVPAVTGAQGAASIKVLERKDAFPSPSAVVEIRNARGQIVTDLGAEHFIIMEDGAPVAPDQVQVEREEGTKQGPVIGLVLDASEALGGREVEAARLAAVEVLKATSSLSSTMPAVVSLFIPSSSPSETTQVPEFAAFTHDHNAIINYLNTQLALRPGTTRLYAGVREAVAKVAETAVDRGVPGYVVVLSDGQDSLSGSMFPTVLDEARENQITFITLGFGHTSGTAGAGQLLQLASSTQGLFLDHPGPEQIKQSMPGTLKVTPRIAYKISYTSQLAADDKPHRWQVLTTLDGVEVASQQMPFSAVLPPQTLLPLGVVMRAYLLRAIPAILLLSGLLTLLLSVWQRMGHEDSRRLSGGLNRAATIKRSSRM